MDVRTKDEAVGINQEKKKGGVSKTVFKALAVNPDLIIRQDKEELSKSTEHASDKIHDFHKSETGY